MNWELFGPPLLTLAGAAAFGLPGWIMYLVLNEGHRRDTLPADEVRVHHTWLALLWPVTLFVLVAENLASYATRFFRLD
jgi:hypothetical protein